MVDCSLPKRWHILTETPTAGPQVACKIILSLTAIFPESLFPRFPVSLGLPQKQEGISKSQELCLVLEHEPYQLLALLSREHRTAKTCAALPRLPVNHDMALWKSPPFQYLRFDCPSAGGRSLF